MFKGSDWMSWCSEKHLPESHRGDIQPQMPPLPPGWGTQHGMLRKVEEEKSNPSELLPPFPVSSIPSVPFGNPAVSLPAAASARCNPHGKKSLWSRFWETPRAVGAAGVTEVTPWWHCPTAWSQGGTSRWDGQTQIKIKALCRKAPRNVLQPLIGFPSPFPPHGDEYSSRTGTGILPKVGYQVWAGLG